MLSPCANNRRLKRKRVEKEIQNYNGTISAFNKAGLVGAIFVKIDQEALFEIKPHVRIPRTCKRLCGVIMELLQKSVMCAKDTNEVLLHVGEELVTSHLPVKSHIVGLSYSSENLVDIQDYVTVLSDDTSPVVVIPVYFHGGCNGEWESKKVSNYPLAAKCYLGLICEALEQKWKVY